MAARSRYFGLLIGTNDRLLSLGFLLLRLAAGVILLVIGASKVLGWFGGRGMEATVQGFSERGFAPFLTYLSSYTEFIGGLLFAIGLFTRPVAVAIAINMLVATIISLPGGFFFGRAAYPFMLLVIALAVLLAGPMAYSVDSVMAASAKAVNRMPEADEAIDSE